MKFKLVIQLIILLILPISIFSQELPEGGEELVTKEQASLFRDKKRTESLFFDANKAKITDNPGQAMSLFKEVIEIDPTHDASYYELGLLYYKQRDIKNSISYISRAYQLNPDNKWYSVTLASLYSQNSQFSEAIEIYEKLCKKDPTDRASSMELANLYLKVEKPSEALKIYDQIESQEGISEEISLRKHHIYLAEGKKKKAQDELEKLAAANEWDSRIQSVLAEFYLMNGMEEKALATYEKILTIEPDNPYINISLADFYRKQGDLKKSVQALKKGFSNQYLDASTKMQILSTYYSQMGNYEGIEDDILEISGILVEQHPFDPQVIAFRAQMLAMKEQYPESLSLFRKVSELDPGKYEVWENILRITALMEKYDSLIIVSNEVISLFPVQPMPYYFNAVGNIMLNKYDEAITSLNTGIKLVFNNNSLMAEFYSMIGDAYYKQQKNIEAFNAYENALRYNPENPLVLNNYAYYLSLANKDLDKALSMAVKANKLSPDNATYLDTYAWVLYKKEMYIEALKIIEQVIKLEPDASGTELEHYGDILYKLGKTEEALNWWKKAIEAGDTSELLPSKIKDGKLYE
ncbi:MAG TPA: tetratricopeptide repeat protein [Lentimicrobium sp.]|nr:tetratricopeptide repeat protein [Lentimicrobium sp.]